MEQLKFNIIRKKNNNIFSFNEVSNYSKKNNEEINPYRKYLREEKKLNLKNISIFNNDLNPKSSYQNNEIIKKQNISIINYYSIPSKNINYQPNIRDQDNSLEKNSLKGNIKDKNNLNYISNKYHSRFKNINLKNLFHSNILKLEAGENDINDTHKKLISYEKNLILGRLNSSNSTNLYN